MTLARLHRRLVVTAALFALLSYAGGVGFVWPSGWLAAAILGLVLIWQPGPALGRRVEQVWLPIALLLVARALFEAFVLRGDLVLPVVDLLLLLLVAEALRPLETPNDARLYALVFALLLASTAYRPGPVFAFAFLGGAVTLVPALVLGHLEREARRHGGTPPRRLPGLAGPALGAACFVVVFAVFVFAAFPRVSRDFPGRDPTSGTPVAGFADQVTLGTHGATIGPNPEVVLRVEFPGGGPPPASALYWRGRSYDRFDGTRWSRTRGLRPAAAPREWYRTRWPGPEVEQRIYAARLDSRVLPALHPVMSVYSTSTINPLLDTAGDLLYWGAGEPVYTALSRLEIPDADSLRVADGRFVPGGRAFLQLPPLEIDIVRLADSLGSSAPTRYDRAVAIRDWFHREFTYTRELPATAQQATLEYFLFERRAGHCEYFSTGMVVLLRALGIEAREVNGFLGGEWNGFGRYLAVTQNEAHSWVEVWFPGFGWVPFDPTPSSVAGSAVGAGANWPGRLLLDGLRHRWNKWVLDYGPERQGDLLDRLRGEEPPVEPGTPAPPRGPQRAPLILLVATVAVILTWMVLQRGGGPRLRPESRTFLRLRRAYARSGVEGADTLGPQALSSRLQAEAAPHAAEAGALLALYQRVRWGSTPAPEERERFRIGVAALVRRLLRDRWRRLLLRRSG
ncbi:MAG: transglutaminaseTgpA domain-containing protein [Gemmatimonadota bacterium]